MYSRKLALAAVSAVVLAAGSGSGYAQVTTGTLVGVVKDATGALVANTPVVATNRDTNVVYQGKTNSAGEYRIGNLPAGFYNVTVRAAGFSPSALQNLEIQANLTRTGDVVVAVASAGATVEVTSEANVSIDTTTTQLGTTFSLKETQDLPVATVGLGVLNLSLLAPGVASTGGIGAGTGPSVGGQRPRNNNFEIDGVDNNSKSVTGPLLFVPNDAVGEFSSLQNVYSAQYGHSTGGQFNSLIVTGTNALHGRAYEYFENRNLNAVGAIQQTANVANGTPGFQPRFDFNRYGAQLGGPILRDRLFIFSNFERQTTGESSASQSFCSPTAAGVAALKTAGTASANNLAGFLQYTPIAANQAAAGGDAGCPNGNTITVTRGVGGAATIVPVGDFSVSPPLFSNEYFSTSSLDYTDQFPGHAAGPLRLQP